MRSDPPFPLREVPHPLGHGRVFKSDERKLTIITSVDGGFIHLSVSHPDHYPDWDELHALRDWWFPSDMEVVMVLPREGEYVNVHPNCFHLWESACGEEGR
jgi:hypothetical protein